MTQELPSDKNEGENGLNWPRIAGLSFVIAIHAAALLLLLAPVAPPGQDKTDEDVTRVVIIEPPPPPPPPPPPDQPKPQEIKQLAPPQPSPIPPPPEEPPVVFDDPSPVDVQAPPPAPPAPPAPVADIGGSVDPSSMRQVIPNYPREELRRCVGGTTVVVVDVAADGSAGEVAIEVSSGNRNLDREVVKAAKRWRFNPAVQGGRKVASRVRVPFQFKPPC